MARRSGSTVDARVAVSVMLRIRLGADVRAAVGGCSSIGIVLNVVVVEFAVNRKTGRVLRQGMAIVIDLEGSWFMSIALCAWRVGV